MHQTFRSTDLLLSNYVLTVLSFSLGSLRSLVHELSRTWRWVHAMEWSGQHEFVSSAEVPFMVDGAKAGVLKTHGPLNLFKVVFVPFNPISDEISSS